MIKQNKKGFTLIELMIVIAIIGILAGVGYPAYTNSVKKGIRADAVDALLKQVGRMEEFYINNDTYQGATLVSTSSSEGKYTISLSGLTDFAYLITATRSPAGDDPECTSLSIDQLGQKTATGTDPTGCW